MKNLAKEGFWVGEKGFEKSQWARGAAPDEPSVDVKL